LYRAGVVKSRWQCDSINTRDLTAKLCSVIAYRTLYNSTAKVFMVYRTLYTRLCIDEVLMLYSNI
jgi:hypothetical protein